LGTSLMSEIKNVTKENSLPNAELELLPERALVD
jgi:hypothetical protein